MVVHVCRILFICSRSVSPDRGPYPKEQIYKIEKVGLPKS